MAELVVARMLAIKKGLIKMNRESIQSVEFSKKEVTLACEMYAKSRGLLKNDETLDVIELTFGSLANESNWATARVRKPS